ncbi:hypothetical protein JCM8097_000038 [Rhodosporidiobolus ruineniae]
MSSPTMGKCCVCGKETKDRCGACAKAGFDLFFCSREHQKLVWFAHKLVCGPKSKPFSFPPLSKTEVERAKSSLHVPYPVADGTVVTLAEDITTVCKEVGPHLLPYMPSPEALVSNLEEGQSPLPGLHPELHYRLRCQVRDTLHVLTYNRLNEPYDKGGPRSAEEKAALLLDHFRPLELCASFAGSVGMRLRPHSRPMLPTREDWYIEIQHGALVFAALRFARYQALLSHYADSARSPLPDRVTELDRYIAHNVARMHALAEAISGEEEKKAVLAGFGALKLAKMTPGV